MPDKDEIPSNCATIQFVESPHLENLSLDNELCIHRSIILLKGTRHRSHCVLLLKYAKVRRL